MNRIILLICFICIAPLLQHCATGNRITFSELEQGEWAYIAAIDSSKPTERHEAAFVRMGEELYLLGGRGIKPTSIFHLKTRNWTEGAAPPLEMHHFQPVVYRDEIYVLGAMTGPYPGEIPVSHIYIYNPEANSWRRGDEIPEHRRRGGAGAVLYEGKIYLVCGIKDGHRGDHKPWLDAYDPKTGAWEILPDAPRARDHFQAIAANGEIYALAGRTTKAADNPFKHTIPEVDVYSLKSRQWETLEANLPTPRAGTFALLADEEILVLGGESFKQEAAHAEVEALHIHKRHWRTLPPMIRGRHGTGAVLLGKKIYVASGCGNRGGSPELADLICYSFP